MPESINNFENNIFINCPYDPGYRQMLRVLIFTVIKCGFEPQIAMEQVNSWDVRINKIKDLIKCSKLSIHDISRMGSPNGENLPRFNLPFELGMDLGCRTYGRGRLKDKKCLILEEKSDRYFKAISDISGNDIKAHQSEPQKLNKVVRSWIRAITGKRTIPGPRKIWENFINSCGS